MWLYTGVAPAWLLLLSLPDTMSWYSSPSGLICLRTGIEINCRCIIGTAYRRGKAQGVTIETVGPYGIYPENCTCTIISAVSLSSIYWASSFSLSGHGALQKLYHGWGYVHYQRSHPAAGWCYPASRKNYGTGSYWKNTVSGCHCRIKINIQGIVSG